MSLPTTLQGHPFGPAQLEQIQSLLRQNPPWSRYRLSRELARLWDWRTATGQLKDMATRTLLLKLHDQGRIELPERRMDSPTRSGRMDRPTEGPWLDQSPVEAALASLVPLRFHEVSQAGRSPARAQLEDCLRRYHYLGYGSRVGQNLQYWVCDVQERPLACVVFGAAAWRCAVRDQWIGWSSGQRAQNLGLITNNTRFLVLPWVRVCHLANQILTALTQRIAADWHAKYRQPLWLLETFVDGQRFAGTCYRSAHWIHLGQTEGRGRQGVHMEILSTSIKEVYVWPLDRCFRQHLTPLHETNPTDHSRATSSAAVIDRDDAPIGSNPRHSGSVRAFALGAVGGRHRPLA
jgi:hypothetical protein